MGLMPRPLIVLIVDDDEGHCELVKRNFRRAGISNGIAVVHNGADALDFVFCRGGYADRDGSEGLLVLLDINMPGALNGLDVLRELKSTTETNLVPVVMLTTTEDDREINRCYELGCTFYLQKPVEPTKFMETIRGLGLLISVARFPTCARNELIHG